MKKKPKKSENMKNQEKIKIRKKNKISQKKVGGIICRFKMK